MADTTALKNRIRAAIKANDNQEITGPVLQQALLDIVDELNGATETEADARQSGDSTLQQNITAEKNRAEGAESTLQQNIAAEKNRAEGAESTLQQNIAAEKNRAEGAETQLNSLITGIKNNIDNGYVYAGIATPSGTPVSGKVFYLAKEAGTYANFGNLVLTQGINVLKYNGSVWLQEQLIEIDDEPDINSNNLVKSCGVMKWAGRMVNVPFYFSPITGAGLLIDIPIIVKTGDNLQVNAVMTNNPTLRAYLIKNDQSYKELTRPSGNTWTIDETIDSNDYVYLRFYSGGVTAPSTLNGSYRIIIKEIVDLSSQVSTIQPFIDSITDIPIVGNHNLVQGDGVLKYAGRFVEIPFVRNGITGNGLIFDIPITASVGDKFVMNAVLENISTMNAFLVKADSTYKELTRYVGSGNNWNIEETIDSSDYVIFRIYCNGVTGSGSINGTFKFIPKEVLEPIDESLLRMCLPTKFFKVKGIDYNLYKSSIMLQPNVKVNAFTYPRTDTNFKADLPQVGEVCHLSDIKDCTLRVGLKDTVVSQTSLIHKDISVVWNDIINPITKKVNVIGDSLTNRGSGHFAELAAQSVGCTLNGFGTMTNYYRYKGEGREGWTFAAFIGKCNRYSSVTITPMGSGTDGSIDKNPFLKEATVADLQNYPQFCFPSTGAASETPYSEDQSAATYYIFDYGHYLDRWADENIPDVITIALGTNDISNYEISDIVSYAQFMVSRIQERLPNVKLGIIPSPAWGIGFDISAKVVPYIEAMKTAFANVQNVEIIGLWCFMSRYLDFGVNMSQNVVANPSTDITPYADTIHFNEGDGAGFPYMEYGKVLASFILTQ